MYLESWDAILLLNRILVAVAGMRWGFMIRGGILHPTTIIPLNSLNPKGALLIICTMTSQNNIQA